MSINPGESGIFAPVNMVAFFLLCCSRTSFSAVVSAISPQAQLEEIRESQDALLQERLKEQQVKYKQDLQIKINQIILEKEEEKKEVWRRGGFSDIGLFSRKSRSP